MDKYDFAIQHLTAHPDQIFMAWTRWYIHPGGCLFAKADSGPMGFVPTGRFCACLTEIRERRMAAVRAPTVDLSYRLTHEIQNDQRIPSNPEKITVADLPVFAEWQRKFDQLIRG